MATKRKAPHPEQRVVVAHADDQEGRDIREGDVVRAETGLIFTEEEIGRFRLRSNARCPTYGSCEYCYKAGPVGLKCDDCDGVGMYKVVFAHPHESERFSRRIVDSERLARLFNRSVQVAKADRVFDWMRTPNLVIERRIVERLFREETKRVNKELFDL